MKTIFDELKQEVKNWWISLILGILYVVVALSLMFFPLKGYFQQTTDQHGNAE